MPPPIARPNIRNPLFGHIWNTRKLTNKSATKSAKQNSSAQQRNQNSNDNQSKKINPYTTTKRKPKRYSSLLNLNSFSTQSANIEDRPTSIYHHNDREFLQSLRNFNEHHQHAITFRTTSLARYMKMSRELVDDFVRLKTNEFEQQDTEITNPIVAKIDQMTPTLNNDSSIGKHFRKNPVTKKRLIRPKSAIATRHKQIANGIIHSKSSTKLNNKPEKCYSDDETECHEGDDDQIPGDNDNQGMKPLFHRSMDRISSIANWERQIRYEFEIEKELQKRELERQREKLQSDQRKLEDWDKQLRIELDARERKLRLGEEELKSRLEDVNQKTNELMRREQMINEIVGERIKAEMKFEIEKLRKKFNELEIDKSNLIKKEERVKEVEARLHEQVKIVKEKIDSKRMSDMELAKYRKELEITKKENEVLKEKVDSMEDYQITKFENRASKNELQILKESLESKNQELERDRERWEREQRSNDQKIMSLKRDLRKAEQEVVLLKQKFQADQEEATSKYEAASGQVKRLKAFIKDHLAKLNYDFSSTTQTLNQFRPSVSFSDGTNHQHQISHHRGHSLYQAPTTSAALNHHRSSYNHQRSISMDGFHKPQNRYSHIRGCRLCNDDDNDLEYDNNHSKYGILHRSGDIRFLHDEEAEEVADRFSSSSKAENDEKQHEQSTTFYKSFETEKVDNENEDTSPKKLGHSSSDEFVRKIVDKIYEKMSYNKLPDLSPIVDDNKDENDDHLNEVHQNQLENHFNPPENASFNRPDQNHHQPSPSVHRTLYEELLLATELETSSSRLNKIDSITTDVSQSPEKTMKNVEQSDSIYSSPLKFQNITQSSHLAMANVSAKLENDTNNNRINGGGEPKTNSNSNGMIMIAKNNSAVSNHSNHSSKSSESFEVDW
nr:putative uncharacterized protein DDB_G0282133 [Dermatophagoides pteronyssinus]